MAWQSFSEHLLKLWDGWEIRALVVLSLSMQIILIIFGSQRKYKKSFCINSLVWLAYLGADMVATVALGCLARSRVDFEANKSLQIQAFWAPFLLLHLGRPDNITAYSLNDNELWRRHFLEFVFQVAVAFYVFIPSWRNKDAFRFIAIPVFVAGIIKYGERILVLYCSSSKQLKDLLYSHPDISEDPSDDEDGKEGSDEEKSADPSNLEDRKEGSNEKKTAGPSNVEDDKEGSDEKKSADPSNLEDGKEGSDEIKSAHPSNLEDRKEGSNEKKTAGPSNVEDDKEGSDEKKSADPSNLEDGKEGSDEIKSAHPSNLEDKEEWSEEKTADPSNLEDIKEASDEEKSIDPSNVEDIKEWSDEEKSVDLSNLEDRKEGNEKKSADNYLIEAVSLFKKFRCLYADLILSHAERKESYSLLEKKSAKEAFKLVTVELGLMYDVLYTKTITIYSKFGIILRCIWLFFHIFLSIFFLIIIDKSSYSPSDISITYMLLFGASFLEFYAFIVLLLSDWTKHWLTEQNKCGTGLLSNDIRRWSGYMAQYNLLEVSLSDYNYAKNELFISLKRLGFKEVMDKYLYVSYEKVDDGLLEKIFYHFREKGRQIDADPLNIQRLKELLGGRGDYALRKRNCYSEFCGSATEVDFDYSLLLWHIATDLCYYDDLHGQNESDEVPPEWKISKRLSNYMLYLLINCPAMLPKGIGEIRYRDTCLDAMRFFRSKKFGLSTKLETACKAILEEYDNNNRNGSLSVLLNGCELAKKLQLYNIDDGRKCKWEMISEVWIEMLGYAASHCGWKEHGEQLTNGGELLTHVCLLMAHLGLSDQYQLQEQPISPHWTTKLFIALHETFKLIITVIVFILVAPISIVMLQFSIPILIVTVVLTIIWQISRLFTPSADRACMATLSWFEKFLSVTQFGTIILEMVKLHISVIVGSYRRVWARRHSYH